MDNINFCSSRITILATAILLISQISLSQPSSSSKIPLQSALNNSIKEKPASYFNHSSITQADAGADQNLCSSETTLSANSPNESDGETGQWLVTKGSVTFEDTTSPTTKIMDISRGVNTLQWTITKDGTTSSAIVTITNNTPTQAYAGMDKNICGSEITLAATNPNLSIGESGSWSVIKGAGTFNDVTNNDTRVTSIAKGQNTYRWTISHKNCSLYDDVVVTNNKVDVNAGDDITTCDNYVTMNAQAPSNSDVGHWTVASGIGYGTFKEQNNPKTMAAGLDYGENGFIWNINHNGCISSDMLIVTNNTPYYTDWQGHKRKLSAGNHRLINVSNVYMDADEPVAGAGIGLWSIISGGGTIIDENDANTLISHLAPGENIFRWTVTNQECSYYSDVTITYSLPSGFNEGSRNSMRIYPNPVESFLNIELEDSFQRIELLSLDGKNVKTINDVNNSTYKLNVSGIKSGIYTLRIIDNDNSTHTELIIIK